jgi:hypothetical protein
MITYTVWYRDNANWSWEPILNVKGDTYDPDLKMRVIITADEEKYEIPLTYMFKFSKERFFAITDLERKKVNDFQG